MSPRSTASDTEKSLPAAPNHVVQAPADLGIAVCSLAIIPLLPEDVLIARIR